MFLSQIAYPEFELVVYTVENFMTFDPVVCQMDPENQIINYRVYSDTLKFSGNRYVKDINTLNRDPGKTIIIDWDKEAVPLALENSLILPKWEGDTRDTSLVALAQLLQSELKLLFYQLGLHNLFEQLSSKPMLMTCVKLCRIIDNSTIRLVYSEKIKESFR